MSGQLYPLLVDMLDGHQVPLCAARKDRTINPIGETTLMERVQFIHSVSNMRTKKTLTKPHFGLDVNKAGNSNILTL